jgi:transposase
MLHFGIDLGGMESQVCVREESGKIVLETIWPTGSLQELLKEYGPSRVVLETCAEAFAVAERIKVLGHDVRVVPATLVRQLGVGARGIKTDIRDARALSEVSCRIELPTVHIPKPVSRDIRAVASLRDALVRSRTLLINTVRGWLRTQLIRVPSGAKQTFAARVRKKLLERPEGMPVAIERQLVVIEELVKQVRSADEEIRSIAENDPTCRLLMTAPGVGPLTAVYFMTVVDEVKRFGGAQAVESYLGLTPGEHSSSLRQARTGITKAGSGQVRRVLVQACWSAWVHADKDPLVEWAQQVAKRRGPKVAVVAMARKLAGILYAMWRDGREYDSRLVTSATSSEEAAA